MILEAFILGLALCVDSLVVSTASTIKSRMAFRRGIIMAAVFAVCQGGFPLIGALIGEAFKEIIDSVDHWVSFALLIMIGGKMIWDAFQEDPDKELDVTRIGVMWLLGVATSIDALAVGIPLGLTRPWGEILLTVGIIGLVTFLISLLGVWLGRRGTAVPEKPASILAGLVLAGMGVKFLIEGLC